MVTVYSKYNKGNLDERECEPDEYANLVQQFRNSGVITTNCFCWIIATNTFKGRALIDWLVLDHGIGKLFL